MHGSQPHLVVQLPGLEGELHIAVVPRDVLGYHLSVSHGVCGLQASALILSPQLPLALRGLWSLLAAPRLQSV